MLKRNISYHISEDRLDRACYIMTTIGLGEIVKEREAIDEKGRLGYKCVTDTGVIVVLNWVYNGKVPSWMFKVVKKNAVHIIAQNK